MISKLKQSVWAAVAVSCVTLSALPAAKAGVITTIGLDLRCLCAPNGLGQSFTAEDSHVSLTVEAGDANAHLYPDPWSITLDFLEGDGPRGNILDSFVFTPLTSGPILSQFTFDLSHITLAIGEQYSYILTSSSGRGVTGRTLGGFNIYDGGRAFTSTGADFGELGFTVTPVALTVALPSAGAWALFGLGFLALSARRRTA